MIKCPNSDCGYENVDGTQFCEGCGEELPQAGAASGASAGAAPASAAGSADMIKCPACDNLNPADNVACEVCGTELHPGAAGDDAGAATPATPSAPATASAPATNAAPAPAVTPAVVTAPVTTPQSVSVPDPNAFTTSTPAPVSAPATTGDTSTGAPGGSGLATPPAATIAAGQDDTQTTASTAPAPAVSVPGISDTPPASASMPVVAAGPVTSGVTTPDTMDAALSPVGAAGGALEPGRLKLVVEQGMTVGKQFVLNDSEILVGREDEDEQIYPDIDLSDQDEGYVHRRHAQMKFENGTLNVTHLGGANKTRVNNKPLPDNEPQSVNIGDKISFGKVVMRLQAN
ncbi:MAG TPA: FHA domain-containing protein [Abditibacteriaceae bacterium]